MREKVDKILEHLKEMKEKIGKKNLVIILIVVIAVIAAIMVLIHVSGIVRYEVLYTGLSQDEQVEILGKLQELGISSESDDNGSISVPEGQSDTARAQLALEGYPKSGLSYDIFTSNVSMTSTDYEKETYKIYELQNRLSATIKYFSGVKDATVTIAVGEKSSYVLSSDESESNTTASVTVIMTDGGSPTAEQVTGIQKLVSSSVPQMNAEDVTVIDGNGNEVSGKDDSEFGDATSLSSLKLQLEESAEASIKAKIKDLLESIYGSEKVRVAVNCTVDIDKKVSELLTYYPSEDGNNSGVTSKMTLDWEGMGDVESPGGVVGTESNSEVPTYPYLTEGDDGNYYADQRTYEYLVSQLTEQIEKNAGEITDTNVAVVIDSGSLTANDIQQITDLVGVTAGIPSDSRSEKVSVMDANFASQEQSDTSQTVFDMIRMSPVMFSAAGGAVLLLIILLILLALLIKKKNRKRELQEAIFKPEYEDNEVEWNTEEPIDLSNMEDTKEKVLREQIREFASQNPEITASLIKNWLKGDEEEGH